MSNILGLTPFQGHPIAIITNKICQILDKHYSQQYHIEIQFKYAEFTAFSNSYFDKQPLPQMLPQSKKKVSEMLSYFVLEQNRLHFQTLKKLSHNSLIHLNPLGSRTYKLYGGFDEIVHKKFYKIRQFLINLCKQNQQNIVSDLNFYREIQQHAFNSKFKIIDANQIRLDINIKHGQGAGRYTYSVRQGWTKTNKQNLIRQEYDLMMVQRTFRLGIKKQKQILVTFQQVLQALNDPASQKGGIFLRIKRALRVTKNNQVQIAVSQIYQPDQQRRGQCIEDLKDMATFQTDYIDQFCQNIFQQFYMWQDSKNQIKSFGQSIVKYEIQSEFMPLGIQKIRDFQKSKNYNALDKYVQTTLQDLYALYFVDHNVKRRQAKVINQILKQRVQGKVQFPECRLQNQYGSYMHDLIYQYMMDN